MQLRPAPGKAIPMCMSGCNDNGTCVKKCTFGTCHNICECDAGYTGVRCEEDVNDCARLQSGDRYSKHTCTARP